MSSVHVVVPDSIHDPARPSGGNTYDRRVCSGLAAIGWSVREHPVPGSWPQPDAMATTALAMVLAGIPDGAVVLLDGLVASTVPGVLVPEAGRLRLVVLVHLPLGDAPVEEGATGAARAEGAVLSAADSVVTTSAWTRTRLLELYPLAPDRVHVATPGVDPAELATGSVTGGQLLTVAAVTPEKGHDVLLAALVAVSDLPWRWCCAGSLSHAPAYVDHLRRRSLGSGLDDRVRFTGPLTGDDLDRAFATADLLVLASRGETYAMVVTEALARGIPVVATAVGGVPEALGQAADGSPPGLLVPAGDPVQLAAALRSWLEDAALRQRLRQAAHERRGTLSGWSATAHRVARVLAAVPA